MRRFLLALALSLSVAAVTVTAASAARLSVVRLSAPVSGLRYDQKLVRAHAGRIRIVFVNRSSVPHNVNIEQGEHELGKTATVTRRTTTLLVRLKPGTYTFYCSVPGHEDAGMHGTLVVR
jgi:plastocyanin